MASKEKLKLLKAYKDTTAKKEIAEVESSDNVESIQQSDSYDAEDTTEVPMAKVRFQPVVDLDFTSQDDDEYEDYIFKPIKLNNNLTVEEENTRDLYEEVKQMIDSIDCEHGIDIAYRQFDDVLKTISDYNSGELTNNQLLILISAMILKLEVLNQHNYPEVDLTKVKDKLDKDGNTAVVSNKLDKYFFESFHKYYQTIELEQFKSLRDKYSSGLQEFSNFQMKKSEMLMLLLKWLIR